jgi:hypothetical protein
MPASYDAPRRGVGLADVAFDLDPFRFEPRP